MYSFAFTTIRPAYLALANGSCPQLKYLLLPRLSREDRDGLIIAINSYGFPLLEGMKLPKGWDSHEGDDFMLPLFQSFEAGGCPRLKELQLYHRKSCGSEIAAAFARVLRLGVFQHFEVMYYGADLPILDAIRDSTCPNLKNLYVGGGYSVIDRARAHVLAEALKAGALTKLESLHLYRWEKDRGEACFVEIMKGLMYRGSCGNHNLKVRFIDKIGMGPDGAAALAEVTTCLPSLDSITIKRNPDIGDEAMAHLNEALDSNCPHLKFRGNKPLHSLLRRN